MIVHWAKVSAAQPNVLSLVPGTSVVEGESHCHTLSSAYDLHTHTMASVCTDTHACTHEHMGVHT